MPRSVYQRLLVILCLGISVLLIPSVQPSEAEEADKKAGQLYVLLRNGEVIRGTVNRDTDHLIVNCSGSVELRIPRKQISFIGANLNSVYEHRANQIVEFHADEHLELASWCLQNGLIGPTMRHALRAETIQPDHPQLLLLKARMERFLIRAHESADADNVKPGVAPTKQTAESTHPPPQAADNFEQTFAQREPVAPTAVPSPAQGSVANNTPLAESRVVAPTAATEELATDPAEAPLESEPDHADIVSPEIDLPAELIQTYTARIQPLLLNRCGAGHCHGHATTSSFQLHRVPGLKNPPREVTMRNLAETLRQLDRANTENSPLLNWGRKAHGQMRSKVLVVSNSKQQQLLAAWLKAVAVGSATSSPENVDENKPTGARTVRDRRPKLRDARIQWQDSAHTKTVTGPEEERLPNAEKEDPFDPKSFNIEFAPKSR